MPFIDIVTGSALSARAETIDGYLVERLPRARLLVPTHDYARQRTHHLIRSGLVSGVLNQPVLTFQEFVTFLLRGTPLEQEWIGDAPQRMILDGVLARMARDGSLDEAGNSARTPGFANHLHRTIGHLKQGAVEPAQFIERTLQGGRNRAIDRVVGKAYAAYQGALKQAKAYDTQGMYWVADLACQKELPARIASLDVLMLDGFDDFTESEFRLVRTIGRHIEGLVFGLVVDIEKAAEDQSLLVRGTLAKIESAFVDEGSRITTLESPEPLAQTQKAALHIFGRDPSPSTGGVQANIEFIECYNARHEADAIAREIKNAIRTRETVPGRVAIVHPEADRAAVRFRAAFRAAGIPLNAQEGTSLGTAGLGVFILSLMDAVVTWSREDVLRVVTSPYAAAPAVNAYEAIALNAGITEGRRAWRERLGRLRDALAKPADSYEAPLAHIPGADRECAALLDRIGVLERFADARPSRATGSSLSAWIEHGLDAFGVAESIAAFPDADAGAVELAGVLSSLDEFRRWRAGDRISGEDAGGAIGRCLRGTQLSRLGDARGVWYGRPEQARHLRFDLVFCAGFTEGAFPLPPSSSAIYGEREREELARLRIPLPGAEWHTQRQASLFQRLFDCARGRMVFTWPRTTSDGATVARSPFVEDLDLLFEEIGRRREGTPSHAVLPGPAVCASPRDARNAILFAGTVGPSFELDGLDGALAGAQVEQRRYSAAAPDEYDGNILDATLRERLATQFDAVHRFSATELQNYLTCPFRFFMERVLRIESKEEPDEYFDPLLRGLILHEVLERFHAQHAGKPLQSIAFTDAERRLAEALDLAFDRWSPRAVQSPPAVMAVEKARLKRRLSRYLDWCYNDPEQQEWAPSFFEVSFGRGGRGGAKPPSTAEPFELGTDSGRILVQGKIDRIDVKDNRIRVIDYKSGAVPAAKAISDGAEIQLLLYALAATELLVPGRSLDSAEYWTPGRTAAADGWRDALKARDRTANALRALVPAAVGIAVAGMRAGRFMLRAEESSCQGCPGGKVCRFEEGRIERKQP